MDSFIFFDTRGKRWPRLRIVMFVTGVLFFLGTILFAQTLFLPSQLKLPAAVQQLKSRLKAMQAKGHQAQPVKTAPLWLNFAKGKGCGTDAAVPASATLPQSGGGRPPARAQAPGGGVTTEVRLGFYQGWDPASFDSLKANAALLTHLCPDWLTVIDGLGELKATSEPKVLELVKEQGLVLMPLLNNMVGDGTWLPEAVEGLINGPADRQDRFVSSLVSELKALEAGGVVVDWEEIDPTYRQALTELLAKMAAALHAEGMELWLCVPMGRELAGLDLDAIARHIDRFVGMFHDENSEFDAPGPIASREWFNGWFHTLVDEYGAPSQWIISLGSYGYDWAENEEEGMAIRFQDAMSRAGRASLATCDFDGPTYNPHFVYEDSGAAHTVWFLDAVTFLSQLTMGRAHHAGGVAISRLGTEDPGIWEVLKLESDRPLPQANLAALLTITPGEAVAHVGTGNLITMADERAEGRRRINLETVETPDGPETLALARYDGFPSYFTVVHQGRGPRDAVALTFDDGPDAEFTPQILDILKDKGVRATFFMVGANMENNPELVRRIVREGHLVGVHTYTHPNIALVSEERAYLEFNATQRLLESLTNHSTVLFRPPYHADTNPHTPEELIPIKLAQKLGYITETEDIDPEDWARPGVETMVEAVKEGRQHGGNIVLLHDAGGNRSQTVEALPQIIDYLRLRGDTVMPLSEMLGVAAEQLMPPVPMNQQSMTRKISETGFKFIHAMTDFFWAFMLVATTLVVLRTFVVAWWAIKNQRVGGDGGARASGPSLPISVLIAAYNEEKVIGETLRAVLATNYAGPIEVVVVDDGSKDRTAEIVGAMMQGDGRIRLLRQVNLGKAMALRAGLAATRHELIISLDADTQFTPDTIDELIRPFADPAVGAVSGRARVGNPKTMVAQFQSLEYTCGFNLDRRAYHQLNCITVVPGAVSALCKSAVQAAGGISTETLAEDTDLTLSLHKCGYKICYASQAVAWTEAPETVRAFAKQRFRWAFGTLQCLWKHREMLFDLKYGALGCFSLPSAWFFNILLVAIGPIVDGILLLSLLLSPANSILWFYFLVFLCADLLLAAVACWIEEEPLRQVWLVLPMRFVYRPVLSFAVLKAIVKASKGAWVGWGKLDRTASVSYQGAS